MLDAFDDRSARAECVYGYYDGEHLELFGAGWNGKLALYPRGENGFGWDRIFEPEGYGDRTRAELTPEESDANYAEIKPFSALRDFFR